MKELLYVRGDYQDFEHGEIVLSSGDEEDFKEELERLLSKYAI